MKLFETEPLARDLEEGLGDIMDSLANYPSDLRLRTKVDTIASIAIAEHLMDRGVMARVITSQPNFDIDPTFEHRLVLVHNDSDTGVIDPTYTRLLTYAGLDAKYVYHGGLNAFPKGKIASFNVEEEKTTVTQLSLVSEYFMARYKPINNFPYISGENMHFAGMNDTQIEARLSEVWNPYNWHPYTPNPATLDTGRRLSRFIVPEHVKLVA